MPHAETDGRGGRVTIPRDLASGGPGGKIEVAQPSSYSALPIDFKNTLTLIFLAGWNSRTWLRATFGIFRPGKVLSAAASSVAQV
jgi:hypothetical protein